MLSDFGNSNMVLGYEELTKITGYNTPSKVANCLSRQGIKYLEGKNSRPWTTLGALELAMGATLTHYGLSSLNSNDDEIEFI